MIKKIEIIFSQKIVFMRLYKDEIINYCDHNKEDLG